MYLGGVPYFLVTTSFEVVVPGGVLLVHSLVICLCDGKLDVLHFAVTRCEMMNHFYCCVILNSLAEQWWEIFVCS